MKEYPKWIVYFACYNKKTAESICEQIIEKTGYICIVGTTKCENCKKGSPLKISKDMEKLGDPSRRKDEVE